MSMLGGHSILKAFWLKRLSFLHSEGSTVVLGVIKKSFGFHFTRGTTYVTGSVSGGTFLMKKCTLRGMFTLFSHKLLRQWKSDIPHRMTKVVRSYFMLTESPDPLYFLQTLRYKFWKSSVSGHTFHYSIFIFKYNCNFDVFYHSVSAEVAFYFINTSNFGRWGFAHFVC
jgi:hypothetical protein